jgi:hypothetical protein
MISNIGRSESGLAANDPIADVLLGRHHVEMEPIEERVLLSADRLGRVAIVERPDGLYCLYSWWHWNVETQIAANVQPVAHRTWSTAYDPALYFDDVSPLVGLYASVDDAELEARHLLGLNHR